LLPYAINKQDILIYIHRINNSVLKFAHHLKSSTTSWLQMTDRRHLIQAILNRRSIV